MPRSAIPNLPDSAVTDESLFRQRRQLMRLPLLLGAGALAACGADAQQPAATGESAGGGGALAGRSMPDFSTDERQTPWELATGYNNFYELGLRKEDPAANAHLLKTDPWSVRVEGACAKPGTVALEDLVDFNALEERTYRLRCVEAWSMVIPWIGVPLGPLLDRFEPLGSARYVAFDTLADPEQMPGLRTQVLEWPYTEGLRLDEARNPLSFMAVGQYGRVLPGQSGAPLRLVIPWKYGFKSIKSIVAIRFSEEEPPTSWNRSAPHEYGFYANVNPTVSHPRWSQARERRIDGAGGLLNPKIETLPFNGYAEQVAGLYQGMDLAKYF